MNIKKLIAIASILLTICLNLDAFRRARVASRRGAIAGTHRYPVGYRGYGVGAGVVGGAIAGTAVVAAAESTAVPEILES